MLYGDILSDMSKVVILNFFRMNIMYSNIGVEIGLDIIGGDVLIFKIQGGFAEGVGECDIASLIPGSLNFGDLFLVALLFFKLAYHVGDISN
jgi:hypothetical protein